MQENWHYRSVIGKLNFIEKSTRPDIAYAVHQCARFSNDPKASHATAVKHIVKYLLTTKDQGIYLRPNEHSFDCWVDADFVGNWNKVNADVDPSTAKSRTGFIINYGGCPVTWASKLQTEVALSTTEAEYNALSTSLRDVIHLMQLVQEANDQGWQTHEGPPTVRCKVFEDNVGALEMARLPKMRPRTKHLCVRLHHFREHVRKKIISIQHIATDLQIADLLTKPQPVALFIKQRAILMRWPMSNVNQSNGDVSTTNLNHLRACGISGDIEVTADNGNIRNGRISMTGICDVTTNHEESATESRTESNDVNEGQSYNSQPRERQNSPQLLSSERDLLESSFQNYAEQSRGVNGEEKEVSTVEIPYTVVQRKKKREK